MCGLQVTAARLCADGEGAAQCTLRRLWSSRRASALQLTHHHDDESDGAEPSSLEESVEAAAAFVKGHASIRTVMVERIDRLRPIQQLTLKV